MTRRITVPLGGTTFSIRDRIRNVGPSPMPQMTLYHFNVGYPLIGPRTQIISKQLEQTWANTDHDAFSEFGAPQDENISERSIHQVLGDRARCQIKNPDNGLVLDVAFDAACLPYLQLIRQLGRGIYMLMIEPCTTAHRSRKSARDAGGLLTLNSGEYQDYAIDIGLSKM